MLDSSGHFAYQITKADKPEDSTMGKLVMTGVGDIPTSFEINGVLGMRIRIGSPNDNDWSVSSAAVTITARVNSFDVPGVYRAPQYYIYVSDIPVYVTPDAKVLAVGERLTTANHETDIEMTMGGWKDGVGPYNKTSDSETIQLIDQWKTSKEDLVGYPLDGFRYQSQGAQNPTDEFSQPYTESGQQSKPGNLPARGTYLRFEPRESGTLMVYVFQKGSKLGFCGFAFVPEGWTPESGVDRVRVKADAVTLSDKDAYKVPGDIENAEVTLLRKFKKDYWTTICLPFSVQETEFKKIFGENAVICTFDKIIKLNLTGEEQNVLHLRQHVYHMIEVGVPYFLKSAVDFEQVVFSNASFESHIQPEFFYSAQMDGFQSKGIYSPTKLPEYSYILNGQFTRRTGGYLLNGYRAYLENLAGAAGDLTTAAGAKLMPFSGFDDLTTGIDDIVVETGDTANPYTNGVLDLQGRKVADYANAVKQLPKGVYIVNGKKIVVR
ncbi:hypothetical protein HMPREF3034_01654 [Prevotella sp. DNF00663]|uniref:hypothetical protein n=1 Tax=Prevotella sp. DNF00663 TaxID=1384078 RepID=UPI000781C09F|nr:hypothetical protein [Prevotella sp. DNF00663]KXB82385.1 hypothetical protein HMPREF3034_01654 [Prevotella sp. DNF00663]